jgi:hypothetical protein
MKNKIKKKEQKRIKKYVRFLKNNREWDFQHIIDMLRFKLKMMRKYLLSEGHVNDEAIQRMTTQIYEVELLLKKVVDDNYFTLLHDDFNRNYGTIEHDFIKIKGTKTSRIEFKWNVPDEKLEEAKEVYHQLMDKADALRKKDLEKAFQLMLENIWGWWD